MLLMSNNKNAKMTVSNCLITIGLSQSELETLVRESCSIIVVNHATALILKKLNEIISYVGAFACIKIKQPLSNICAPKFNYDTDSKKKNGGGLSEHKKDVLYDNENFFDDAVENYLKAFVRNCVSQSCKSIAQDTCFFDYEQDEMCINLNTRDVDVSSTSDPLDSLEVSTENDSDTTLPSAEIVDNLSLKDNGSHGSKQGIGGSELQVERENEHVDYESPSEMISDLEIQASLEKRVSLTVNTDRDGIQNENNMEMRDLDIHRESHSDKWGQLLDDWARSKQERLTSRGAEALVKMQNRGLDTLVKMESRKVEYSDCEKREIENRGSNEVKIVTEVENDLNHIPTYLQQKGTQRNVQELLNSIFGKRSRRQQCVKFEFFGSKSAAEDDTQLEKLHECLQDYAKCEEPYSHKQEALHRAPAMGKGSSCHQCKSFGHCRSKCITDIYTQLIYRQPLLGKLQENHFFNHSALCEQMKRRRILCPWIYQMRSVLPVTLLAYPMTRVGNSTAGASEGPNNNMNMLMNHEVFRLCSFGYARFPPNEDILVTRLAHGGFYSIGRSGRVRCFSCQREYLVNLSGSPMENVHEPHCQRHQLNIPLQEWMNGLPRDALSMYVREYGNLTPTLFEDTEPIDSSHQFTSSAREFRDGPGDSGHHSSGSSGYGSRNPNASITLPLSDSSAGASNDLDQSDAGSGDTETPEESSGGNSAALSGSFDETSDANSSGHDRRSLQQQQHELTQVSQESDPVIGNRNVLTSAARNPMAMDNRNGQRSGNGEAQGENSSDSSAEGAVGGSEQFDLRRASYPQFASSHARRLTFSQWSPDHPQRPETLVAAGFFYAGYADCVRCFFCGLGLKFWRPTDIPAYQHARFRPLCVYNRMYKGQEYIDRVQQDVNPVQNANNQTESATQPPAAAAPTAPEPQDSTHMRSEAAQQALRTGWSRDQVSRAIQHIVTELGVGEIQQDLLTDVLAQLNPESEVLQGHGLGSADSESTNESEHLSDNNNENDPVDNTIASVRAQPSTPADQQTEQQSAGTELPDGGAVAESPADRNTQEYKLVHRENVYLSERATCSICNSRPVSCIFMPCGHVVACQTCADDTNQCLMCGKEIIATANIFLA